MGWRLHCRPFHLTGRSHRILRRSRLGFAGLSRPLFGISCCCDLSQPICDLVDRWLTLGLHSVVAHPRSSFPDIVITGVEKFPRPSWANHFHAHISAWSEFESRTTLPGLTVLCVPHHGHFSDKWIQPLVTKHLQTSAYSVILLKLDDELSPENMARVIGKFPESTDVEFLLKSDNARTTVSKLLARVMARNRAAHALSPPAPLLLSEDRSRIDATSDLRNESGRLSVRRVAEVFRLPAANIAEFLGAKRQTVSKTDDAPKLQAKLEPFERIARLRLALSQKQFLSWLQSPHKQLEKRTPLDVIAYGGAETVADLVEDMLTGSPA
jgi:hypothetical protein